MTAPSSPDRPGPTSPHPLPKTEAITAMFLHEWEDEMARHLRSMKVR